MSTVTADLSAFIIMKKFTARTTAMALLSAEAAIRLKFGSTAQKYSHRANADGGIQTTSSSLCLSKKGSIRSL
jgi:hypothetical protein